ncbi:hypothetical protein DV736_g6161, partial [Chaetothyriales sp. CBS 134916]
MNWHRFGRISPTIESQSTGESRNSVETMSTSGARASKFPGLIGFLVQNDNGAAELAYTHGHAVCYAAVGRVFFINHQNDEEINHRVVVIWRTNRDSWSCYSFCKHDDKDDYESKEFKDDHIKVIANPSATRQIDTKPVVAVDLRNIREELVLADHIWINCREVLDIKHTVRLAPLGCVAHDSLTQLLDKGKEIFLRTFADQDKALDLTLSRVLVYRSKKPRK